MSECPFCHKMQTEKGLGMIVNFEPLNPVTKGHRLFVPRSHVVHPSPYFLGTAMTHAEEWARQEGEQYNLITSSGTAATMSIEHLHVHYVPRREGDGLHLPWTNQQEK